MRTRKLLGCVVIGLLIAMPSATGAAAVGDGPHGPPRVAGRLIVCRDPRVSREAAAAVLHAHGLREVAALDAVGATVVEVAEANLPNVERRLRGSGLFRGVERDYLARVAELPDDPYLSAQWGVTRIFAPEAWAVSVGSGVPVAVIDTGIDATHPDLQGQVLPGYDFVNADADPFDDHGHGTRMAGIVAARAGNAEGIAGIAPQAALLPVKVLDADGYGAYSAVVSGIIYAVDNGARVLNLSLSGTVESAVLQDAVDYAAAHDVVVVAAAGNYGIDLPAYPAAARGAVAVSAINQDDARPSFSNFGDWIDVAAPGVDIVTTSVNHGYASTSGTSPAAAFASGVFALLRAAESSLSASAAVTRVLDGAMDLGSAGRDDSFGWGLVDAFGALVADHHPPPVDSAAPEVRVVAPVSGSLLSGLVPVAVAASDDGVIDRVELFVDGVWQGVLAAPPYVFSVDAGALEPGKHRLSATAYDGVGHAGRSRPVRVLSTDGQGLLVARAVASSSRLRLVGTFALPAGTDFDPRFDALEVSVSSAAGMMLAFTVEAGTMSSGGRTLQTTVAPSVPTAGTVRVAAKGVAPGVYAVRVRAAQLAGAPAPSSALQVAVVVGGAVLTQTVTGRVGSTGDAWRLAP